MSEREIKGIAIVGGLVLLGFAVINQAYRAGFATGLAQSGDPAALTRIDGYGFFPFPPFLLIAAGVVLFLIWRRRGNGNAHGRGAGRPPRIFEEWHRQAHEARIEPASPATSGRPGGTPSGAPESGAPQPQGNAGASRTL